MDPLIYIQQQVLSEINQLTQNTINKLSDIWRQTFDQQMCEDNLTKLTEHVSLFYDDVVLESVQRQNVIKEDIERLHEEALTLRRLLNVDVPLSPSKDTPLYIAQIKLDESLQDLREMLKKRNEQIYELLLEQDALCEELGEPPRPLLNDPLPTEAMIQDFRYHLDFLKEEKVTRQNQVSTYRRDIKILLKNLELQILSEEEDSFLNDRHILLTSANIAKLRELRDNYQRQMDELREGIDSMRKKITILWDCLEVSANVRDKFVKYNDYTQTIYDKLHRELARCETQKRQNIKRFVDKIREEIMLWWDKTLKSDVERSRFSNFSNDCFTEDLLTLHEMELEDLKRFYHDNEKIFELIAERRTLWDHMIALESKASDPARYNNRGGQLLKEEKERKIIASKLPKIESKLLELVKEYEDRAKRKFLVYGQDIVELIEQEWEQKQVEKEKIMSARKNAIGTPLSKSILRTPLSNKNQTASIIKKTPSSTNITGISSSIKRKIPPCNYSSRAVKRSLMSELASPNLFVRPQFKTPSKSPLKKMRVFASTIKRQSGRHSGNSKSRRKSNKTPKKLPKVIVTAADSSVRSDSISYELFEEHIDRDPIYRSSIVCPSGQENVRRTRNSKRIQTVAKVLPNPRLAKTPSRLNIDGHALSMRKSPASSLSRTASPLAGPSTRKLTTKNLPILI